MDTDEAWERFCRDTVHMDKSSLNEKIDTLTAAVNEMRTDVERTAQIVPSIMGDEAAVDTANAAATGVPPQEDALGMDSGIPGDVSGGTGMDLAGDAMATDEAVPPEAQAAGAPPAPGAPPMADETMPPVESGMGDEGMADAPLSEEGPAGAPSEAPADEGDEWTDEDDAFLERILAEAGGDGADAIGGDAVADMPESEPAPAPAPVSMQDTFNNALKDAYASAVDSNDSEAIARLGKLREKIAPLLDEFSTIVNGPAAAPAAEALGAAQEGDAPVDEGAPSTETDADAADDAGEDAPEGLPESKGSDAPAGDKDDGEPNGSEDSEKDEDEPSEDSKEEKSDEKKDKVEKSCNGSEAVMDDSIEKDGIGIGDDGVANALMDEGAGKQDANGGLKDMEDTLSKSDCDMSFEDLVKSGTRGTPLMDALLNGDGMSAPARYTPHVDPLAKGFMDRDDKIASARSIFDMKIGKEADKPDLNDLLTDPMDIPSRDGHQDPSQIADAKEPEISRTVDDMGGAERTEFADAGMEPGEKSRQKVKAPVIKGDEEGRHIMTFAEMCRVTKGDRPGLAASTMTHDPDDSLTKSSEPVAIGRGVNPIEVVMDDLDRYNVFKEKSDF